VQGCKLYTEVGNVLVVVHRDFQSPGSKFSRRCLYFVALVYGISDISVS